ncbi:MAG: adenylosuccinate lyase, partial [Firmicutes bacterium]|nr:adenylosuccinate lyase [Bacillota bacterium]
MPSTVVDSAVFGYNFSTPETRSLFEDHTIIQNWLLIEAALARTQAELSIIPAEAAAEIERKADVRHIDFQDIAEGAATTHHSLITLLRVLQNMCSGNAGEYIHMGATTQDIFDTGYMLSITKAFDIIYRDVSAAQSELIRMVRTYRDTPMAGRSHTQQALPITFGYKVAVWASEHRRNIERLEEC